MNECEKKASLYANLKEEAKLEIAKAMMAKGIDLATIAECTGLSEEQVGQI